MRTKHCIGATLAIMFSFTRCTTREPMTNDLEWPPSLATVVQQAPTVDFCELVCHPEEFDKKIVRTQAVFQAGNENEFLYDPECNKEEAYVWSALDPSYVYTDERVKKRLTELLRPTLASASSTAQVTIVGRFEGPNAHGYGHLDGYRFRFSIMRIEKAEPLAVSVNSHKIKE